MPDRASIAYAVPADPSQPTDQVPTDGRADVLVVDDTPTNLQILVRMLKAEGFGVRPVPSGAMALTAAARQVPDLVLLDINMPEMNGYEVCEAFKADPKLCEVPILFISALSSTGDKMRAFEVGGIDYITKPFQLGEVRARVTTHLRLHRLQQELAARNAELKESLAKEKELEHLRDSLTHMLVHDMRSPLSGISASLEFLRDDVGALIPEENRTDIERAITAGRRLMGMVSNLLDVSRMENQGIELELGTHPAAQLVADARSTVGGLIRTHTVVEELTPELDIRCDRDLVTRMLVNLVANALKHTPPGGEITIRARCDDGITRVEVSDSGQGIPREYHELIFEKFGQAKLRGQTRGPSSGLGLPFCRLAVAAHGGEIGVLSEEGQGSTFWFTIPPA